MLAAIWATVVGLLAILCILTIIGIPIGIALFMLAGAPFGYLLHLRGLGR
jgi:uncharacterized membrane protein YccF (DUF307 family)